MSGVAFVTGAASGIGAATVRELAARGIAVAAVDRDGDGAARTIADVRRTRARAVALCADVTDDAAMAAAVADAERELGPLTVVVAAAGRESPGTITQISVEDWRRAVDVNLTGVFLTARHTVPRLIARGGGAFTAVSSDVGFRGSEGEIAYSAAKHGVVGLVRCLAVDHGRQGVRANAVCPGFVDTPMADRLLGPGRDRSPYEDTIPLGRFAQPEHIAKVIAHLSCAEAAHTNGIVYVVDGGASAGFFTAQGPVWAP